MQHAPILLLRLLLHRLFSILTSLGLLRLLRLLIGDRSLLVTVATVIVICGSGLALGLALLQHVSVRFEHRYSISDVPSESR